MKPLKLRPDFANRVRKLVSLSDEDRSELVKILESAPVSFDPRETLWGLISQIPGLQTEARDLAEILSSLYLLRSTYDEGLDDIVGMIYEAVDESSEDKIDQAENEFKSKLGTILSVNHFLLSAKIVGIRLNYDKLFERATLTTDIRPIWGDTTAEPPKAAVIVHQLNIHYLQDGEHKEFFIALDDGDVESVIKILNRALQKSKSLESVIEQSNLEYIDK